MQICFVVMAIQSLSLTLLTCFAVGVSSNLSESGFVSTVKNTSPRDYVVTSENYPNPYPAHENASWEWEVPSGKWVIVFLDFEITGCGLFDYDRLIIRDGEKELVYTCNHKPVQTYFTKGPSFKIEFYSNGARSQSVRGFKFNVMFGNSKDELQMKIDAIQTTQKPISDKGDLSNTVLIVLFFVIVVIVGTIVSFIVLLLIRWRRLHGPTRTSVHLNIGAIRSDSSITYTRDGGRRGEADGRSRLESDGSLSLEPTSPKRPVKRSDSNASWAMRAEMAASGRTGSCSSGEHKNTVNMYFPYPGDPANVPSLSSSDKHEKKVPSGSTELHAFNSPLLIAIPEEANDTETYLTPLPVPVCKNAVFAVSNDGYMLMNNGGSLYANAY